MNEKLKILWICHFSNKNIREMLPLSRWTGYFNLQNKNRERFSYFDFAPWISNLIAEFEKINDIELHVVSPHLGLKSNICEFEMKNIYYHFFKPNDNKIIIKLWYRLFSDKNRKFKQNRHLVSSIINNVKPNLINLYGTENPYFSITVLDVKNIPVIVSLQTIYSIQNSYRNLSRLRCKVELEIIKKNKYFGTEDLPYYEYLVNNCKEPIVFRTAFTKEPPQTIDVYKEYDFTFFATGLSESKGVEDALDALAIAKREKYDVTLNLIGRCSPEYKNKLLKKISLLELNNNIIFNDFFPEHIDMLKHIKKSKYALLPSKIDILSSTIIEAMFSGLAVVTYKTSGTLELNHERQCVLLAEMSNTSDLADKMLELLKSNEIANELKKNSSILLKNKFCNKNIALELVDVYYNIYHHYYYGTEISKELLFFHNILS